jgi:flagellar hook-length control protein FliK
MAEGARANNIIQFNPRSRAGLARPDDFTDPALADRVAALETQLIALEANLTRERNLLTQLSDSDAAMGAAAWGSSQNARDHDSERNARALLERAISERQALADQVAKLRAERDGLLSEIEALRLGAAPAAAEPAPPEPKEEKLDDVVGALRAAVQGLADDLRAPEAPAPALQEDVDELPPPASSVAPIVDDDVPAASTPAQDEAELQKAREFGLIEDEDVLAPAEPALETGAAEDAATIEETDPVVTAPPTTPDPSVAAMWDALPPPAVPAAAPAEAPPLPAATSEIPFASTAAAAVLPAPIVIERASFITDEFIFETSPLLRAVVIEADPIIEVEPIIAPVAAKIEPPAPAVEIAKPISHTPITPVVHAPIISEPALREAVATAAPAPEMVRASNQIQLVISPIESFARLLEVQHRLEMVSSIHELRLRDYRNGIATFALSVGEAISAHEFGAVVQMLGFGLRLMGATAMNAELRLDEDPATA